MSGRVYTNYKKVRSRHGRREDLGGLYCRSAMEADWVRILEWLKAKGAVIAYAHEPKVFHFADYGYKRGPWAYTPDTVVWWSEDLEVRGLQEILPGERPRVFVELPMEWFYEKPRYPTAQGRFEWFEVKGRETSSDRSKLKRMAKHYPETKITMVGQPQWTGLANFFGPLIPTWETRFRGRGRR